MFAINPAVFAAKDEYQIIFKLDQPAYVHIKVGDKVYDDESCGVLLSSAGMRKITVPQYELDGAGEYTVFVDVIEKRQSYCTKIIESKSKSFPFFPVKKGWKVKAFELGDTHGDIDNALKLVEYCKDYDFLILNGDIPNDFGTFERAEMIVRLAAEATAGEKPVISVRGNHETRGEAAEFFDLYSSTKDGKPYFTFRLGDIWGLALDCGEDKPDNHREYGGSVRFERFRRKETEFIKEVINNRAAEYEAEGVKHRIVIVHNPFLCKYETPFDVDEDVFKEWNELIKQIEPEVMICAHTHRVESLNENPEMLIADPPCSLITGTIMNDNIIGGTEFIFDENGFSVEVKKVNKK